MDRRSPNNRRKKVDMGRSGRWNGRAAPKVKPEKESPRPNNKGKGKARKATATAARKSTRKTKASSPRDTIVQVFIVPRETDIACGRGKGVTKRPGNQNYHKILQESRELYLAAKSTYEKSRTIELFRKRLVDETGRFIKFNKMNQCFEEISPKKAHQKIGQAIRYVIHGKEPRNETAGDKQPKGKKTRTTSKKRGGGSKDEQQQQQQKDPSSSISISVPSTDPSDAASVSASSDDSAAAAEEFVTDFTVKKDDGDLMMMSNNEDAAAVLCDLQRGLFLEGIQFASPQDEKEPQPSKCPSMVISPSAVAVTSISDVDVEKGIMMMQQDNAGNGRIPSLLALGRLFLTKDSERICFIKVFVASCC